MNPSRLLKQNQLLRQRIKQIKDKRPQSNKLSTQLQQFTQKSKINIKAMSQNALLQQQQMNQTLHEASLKYQNVLKQQIKLLTQNKNLTQRKDQKDAKINNEVQKITKHYEKQIMEMEKKVKQNVRRIKDMSSENIIKNLIKNKKFKDFMQKRGCNLQGLQKQSQIQSIAQEVEQIQKKIQAAQLKSTALDQQLQKMQQLIQTMRQLLDNMVMEKQNILKQNQILKQKLDQSQQLITKPNQGISNG